MFYLGLESINTCVSVLWVCTALIEMVDGPEWRALWDQAQLVRDKTV